MERQVRDKSDLRVGTFNIKHAATTGGYLGKPWLLGKICANLDVDILALQEVDNGVWRSWFSDLTRRAAGTTYTTAAFTKALGANAVSLVNPGGQYGLALLAKGALVRQTVLPLSGDYVRLPFGKRRNVAPEPRIAVFSELQTDSGHQVSVANTHFGGPLREKFLGSVVTRLASCPTPQILLGDYNTGRRDMGHWLATAGLPLTLAAHPSGLPDGYRQSDHIAVNGFTIDATHAVWTEISDHPAIIASLSLET